MNMHRRDPIHSLISLLVVAVTMMMVELQAEGLPFKVELYEPIHLNTIVVPKGNKASTPDSLYKLTGVIEKVRLPIWTSQARNVIEAQTDGYELATVRPDEEQPQGFVEVTEVTKDGAAWLKLKFREVDLGKAKLIISSPTSGHSQTFTSTQLNEWQGQSAMFFGDRLRVQLRVAPDSGIPMPVDDLIEKVFVGESVIPKGLYPEEDPNQTPEQQAADDEELPCGHDTREFSNEPRVGRMMPATCTVSILEGGVYATAGHCFRDNREIQQEVQFNVPQSSASGKPSEPAKKDVYAVRSDTIVCSDCMSEHLKHGKDWAVFLLSRNTETGLEAIEAQAGSFEILSNSAAHALSDIRIDGYGFDSNPLTAMYAQQTAKGKFATNSNSTDNDVELQHFVDTQVGNSGSPMIALGNTDSDIKSVVGIHTGGHCDSETREPNKGTGFSHKGLLQAVEKLRNWHVNDR